MLLVALFAGLSKLLLYFAVKLTPCPQPPQLTRSTPLDRPAVHACLPSSTTPTISTMSWFQKTFTLPPKSRGSYLITDQVVSALPELKDYKVGILNLFVQHTSCALSLNENWDSDVREDMSDALDRIAPEDRKGNLYRHSAEGLDDMPVGTILDRPARKVNTLAGPYQVGADRRQCQHPDHRRPSEHRHMAGHLVSRVPRRQAFKKSRGHHPGGEALTTTSRCQ